MEDVSKDSAAVLEFTLATDVTAGVKKIEKARLQNWQDYTREAGDHFFFLTFLYAILSYTSKITELGTD